MSRKPNTDDTPKPKAAKRAKLVMRPYFIPEFGVTVEASDAAEAVKLHKQQRKSEKEQEEAE